MIVIIDYGMGNLHSIKSKIEKLKYEAVISSKPEIIEKASKLILPGIGHFAKGMENLIQNNLVDILTQRVMKEKTPLLGICLGMQLLTNHSEEGNIDGLRWIDVRTKRFNLSDSEENLRIPHVGWNRFLVKNESILLNNLPLDIRFYFVHSYYVSSEKPEYIIAESNYGRVFASMIQKENIYGTQFHPEKSHQYGLQLIDNFLKFS